MKIPLAQVACMDHHLGMNSALTEDAQTLLMLIASFDGGPTPPLPAAHVDSEILAELTAPGLVEVRADGRAIVTLDGCDAVDAIRRVSAA